MDQLTLDCIAARKAGMTYGKWKALQPRVEVVMPEQEVEEPEVEKGIPKQLCRTCGKEIVGHANRRYCNDDCRYEEIKRRSLAYYLRKKERMMANGKV